VCAIGHGHVVVMVLLDLSSAFDTVDHHTLQLSILQHRFSVTWQSLAWFNSYLTNRIGCRCFPLIPARPLVYLSDPVFFNVPALVLLSSHHKPKVQPLSSPGMLSITVCLPMTRSPTISVHYQISHVWQLVCHPVLRIWTTPMLPFGYNSICLQPI